MDKSRAIEILEKALRLADADAVEASIDGGTECCTRFADNVITQNSSKTDITLRVKCAYGKQHASAVTNLTSDESIKSVVERAQSAARVSPPDPEYMPPLDATEMEKYLKVNSYSDRTASSSPDARAEAVKKAAGPVQSAGYRLSGAFICGSQFSAFVNSSGLRAFHRFTDAETHTTVLGDNGSGWAQSSSNNIDEISVEETSARAFAIARDAQSPADIDPGKYTVILSSAAVQEMIYYMICDAKATDEGRTFLRGQSGKQICNEIITLRSDPGDLRCPGMPFQQDGLASPKLSWIDKGVLRNLSTSRFWASKTGRMPTGYPSNIIMDGTDATVDEMVSSTEHGILVVRFWYIRYVNPMKSLLTGMTRDGLFLIRDGKIAGPVKQLRFNESVQDVLGRVEMLGKSERIGWTLIPALKVRDFNFSSATKF